jgi:redox-sensing transcriptional repressor
MTQIPTATVGRLVTYLRVLAEFEEEGTLKTSSEELARRAHGSAFQVRKDLSYCGRLGTRGSGYAVPLLQRELRRVLGLTRPWNVAIMGMGRLGQAIAHYPSLVQYDFLLRGGFDADRRKVGMRIGELVVSHVDDLAAVVASQEIAMALLTVPVEAAQSAADGLVAAGVRGIVNFAPTVLEVPEGVHVEDVDFLAGLKRLSFLVGRGLAEEG